MWLVYTEEYGIVQIGDQKECEERYEKEKEKYQDEALPYVDVDDMGHQVYLMKVEKTFGHYECPDGLFDLKELNGADLEEQ
ncbi:hypothetical protein EQ871_14480 [Enterococcus casseliflavus]|uniref:hypothetical protein n=1 Tax=Enterococcus TaxID=1350 RepID=UPI000FFBE3FD|nr:hypothetical protein [Enterococcus casseliflavus]RXA60499.1 hypothetical protein EQ871_14480 [Enterococcus casseliflavus]